MNSVVRIIAITMTAAAFVAGLFSSSDAQRRPRPFSHNTPAHKNGKYADCTICHKLPSPDWQKPRRDGASPYPDITNFPNPHGRGNAAVCITCHTRDVYTDGGLFCGTCHTVASMRATGGRGVLPYPPPNRRRQFNPIFPHDVHQDLIAGNESRGYATGHFVPVSFNSADDKPKPEFYNCAICHKTTAQMPKYQPRKLDDLKPLTEIVPDSFERPVTAAFFKDSPTGHASCFTCHYGYKNLPVGKRNCAACHELTTPYTEKKAIERYSIKFDHDRDGHGDKDCTSCHLRITQQPKISLMKDADVPIAACWSCHATQEQERSRRILFAEIEAREASIANKQPVFQCTYCHTSSIGRFEIPASHRKP